MKKINKGILISATIFILSFLGFISVDNFLKDGDLFSGILFTMFLMIFGAGMFGGFIGLLISLFSSKNKETEEVPSKSYLITKKIFIIILVILLLVIAGAYIYITSFTG